MSGIDDSLRQLRDASWQLAVKCREEEDTEAFRVLLDIDTELADLLRGRSGTQESSADERSGLVTIFSPDHKHTAKLDPERWTKQKGSKCVLVEGKWTTLSRSAFNITHCQTRGPEWWRYEDAGQIRPVSVLKPL